MMKRKDWHGNRLRSPEEAKEMKKKRSRERYARREKMINRFWLHNKILRELVHLFGVGTPISMAHFDNRGFDSTICKEEEISNGQLYMCYDKYKIHITPEKNIVIWKI
jgi:hypothetical protein